MDCPASQSHGDGAPSPLLPPPLLLAGDDAKVMTASNNRADSIISCCVPRAGHSYE
jgi:hypothetical protein